MAVIVVGMAALAGVARGAVTTAIMAPCGQPCLDPDQVRAQSPAPSTSLARVFQFPVLTAFLHRAVASQRLFDVGKSTLQIGQLCRMFRLAAMWIYYRLAIGALAMLALILLFAMEFGLASAIARREEGFSQSPDEQGP
ncbi:hypothetical protein [Cupriavidus basilensis]